MYWNGDGNLIQHKLGQIGADRNRACLRLVNPGQLLTARGMTLRVTRLLRAFALRPASVPPLRLLVAFGGAAPSRVNSPTCLVGGTI